MRIVHFAIIFFIFCTVNHVYAEESTLVLIDNGKRVEVAVDDLRVQADQLFTLYDPFRGVEVEIRGIMLDKVLDEHLGRLPKQIKFTAYDGYDLTFNSWKKDNWVIVTHEDGEPISLRQRGPLRLVERDIGDKNPKNLRDFNDWVWMLKTVEVLP